jgi:hypothetical protein
MKKLLLALGICLPLISSCLPSQVRTPPFSHSEMGLSEFIIGKWEGESRSSPGDNDEAIIRSQLEFIDNDTLVYNQVLAQGHQPPRLQYYNFPFQYDFMDPTHIRIQSRLVDEWNVARDGEYLVVSNSSFIPNGRYRRMPAIGWRLIAVLAGFLVIGIVLTVCLALRGKKPTAHDEASDTGLEHGSGKRAILSILAVAGGLLLGRFAWPLWDFLLITLPWDAVILLEVCLGFAIIGVWLNAKSSPASLLQKSRNKIGLYLGLMILGVGFWGIFLGLARLIAYVILGGSYGLGA